jgi:DNA-directed RNA polymerase sigma subunit (sigma70/sigma32)
MIDLLQDETMPSPQEDITRFLQHERIDALLQKMSERERRVLVLRYGLDDGVSRTLGETAKFFGITRERVRQIEVVAIRKFRALLATEEPETAQQAAASAAQLVKANAKTAASQKRRRGRAA